MKALLVIDVTESYLKNYNHYKYDEAITTFLNNLEKRLQDLQNELVYIFFDVVGNSAPDNLREYWHMHTVIEKPEWSAFSKKGFHKELQDKGITLLEICGLFTQFCVLETVQDALKLGYDVVVNPHLILGDGGELGEGLWLLQKIENEKLTIL